MSDMEDNTDFEPDNAPELIDDSASINEAEPSSEAVAPEADSALSDCPADPAEDPHHFKLSPSELRQRLTIKCKKAKEIMRELIQEHQALKERTAGDRLELCHNLLEVLSVVLDSEDWGYSPFVSKVMEPLQTMRSDLQALEKSLEEGGEAKVKSRRAGAASDKRICRDDDVSMFILLYQVDGADMKKWTSQLKNLSHSIVSRPIYPNEKSARRMIQARHNTNTDAYVKVSIPKHLLSDQAGRKRRDRLGQPLLALTTNKIDPRCIDYFVHDRISYRFEGEMLEQINHNE